MNAIPKKLLAFLLVFMMVLSMIPTTAFAAESTSETPNVELNAQTVAGTIKFEPVTGDSLSYVLGRLEVSSNLFPLAGGIKIVEIAVNADVEETEPVTLKYNTEISGNGSVSGELVLAEGAALKIADTVEIANLTVTDAEGNKMVKGEDGTFSVQEEPETKGIKIVILDKNGNETITLDYSNDDPQDDGTLIGESLTQGIDYSAFLFGAEGPFTYKLILQQDIEVSVMTAIPADTSVVIDLNGHKITSGYQEGSDSKHLYPFDVYGNLTITDSVGNGSISGRGIYVQDGATVTVESGAIYGIDANGGSALYQYGGDIVINGGLVEQKAEGTSNFAINAAGGTVTVDGGKIAGNHGAIAAVGAAVEINNGELVCTGSADMTDNVLYCDGTSTITINGGTFIADKDLPSGGCCIYDANGGVTVNDGDFSNSSGGDVWGTTGTTINGGTFENLIETQHVTVGSTITNGGKQYTMTENGLEEASSAVAEVNGVGYATLAEALTAASAMTGDVTVKIYDKVTLSSSLSGSFDSIKFVGMEDDAEIYLEVEGYITATGKKVAFEDLKLSKSEGGYITNAGFMNVAFGIYDVTEVTYTDCTFVNGAYASSGKVTYTGCTFYRSYDKYGLWAYGDVEIVVDGCIFDDYRGIKMYAEGAAKTVDLTVKNTDFSKLDGKPAIVLTYGESVTLEGNTYSDTGVFELDKDGAPNGTPVTSTDAITCVNDDGVCGVLVDGKIYTTVAQAAEVATAGSKVTLLHASTETVELAEGVVLDKNGYVADGVTVKTPATLEGEGTEANPYLINDLDDLKIFQEMVNGGETFDNQFVKLTADINLNSVAWTPIGNSTNRFLGTFDGDNHTISNLVVDVDTNNAGLFGFASVIKNVKINNAKVSGVICVGALVGELESSVGTVDNCHVTGTIQITGENSVGGLAGKGYANIKNSSVIGNADSLVLGVYGSTEEGDNIGGLMGHLGEGNTLGVNNVTVKDITVKGTRKVGGVLGTTARANDIIGCTVENVTVESTATADYANANASTTTIGGVIGNYFGSATTGGILQDCKVNDVNLVIGNAKSAGALVGGDRVNNGGAPVGIDTVSGNTATNVTGATNKYLMPVAAQIGDETYETLADALAAAKTMTGDVVVEIYDKVTLATEFSGSYDSIKFVGVEDDAEIYMDVQGSIYATGEKVAFENLKLSKVAGGYVADAGFRNLAFGLYGTEEITYTNCTFANGAYASTGKATFEDCIIYRSHDRYGMWVYGDVDVTVDGCTFADIRGIKMYDEEHTGLGALTVKNTDFSAVDGKPAIVLTYGESVTLENNTYNASQGVFELDLDGAPNGTPVTSDVAPTCKNDNGACGVLVDGKIYTTVAQAAEVATSGSEVTLLHNSTETVELETGVVLDKNGFEAPGVTVKVPAVAKIGDETYATLAEAIAAAQNGETVVVLKDIELEDSLTIPAGKTLTLDLNGKTVSQTKAQTAGYQMLLNDGNLTIDDSIGGGKISYTDTVGGNFISNTITNRGTLTLKSGTVENLSSADVANVGFPYAIDTSIYGAASEVVVNIEGGTVTCANYSALRIFAQSTSEPITINISGGEINGRVEVQNPSNKTTDDYAYVGVLNITGGTINQHNSSMAIMIFGDSSTAAGLDVNISGGTVTGKVGYHSKFPVVNFDENVITGGTFNTDVSEFCALGYVCEANGDGTYGVKVDPAYGKVAKIGDTYYEDLDAAFAAAKSGDTITLLKDATMTNAFDIRDMILTIDGTGTLNTDDKLNVYGESTLNISVPVSGDINLCNGAILKDSTINGNVFVAGNVTFRGDNTVNMIYDYGTLTDYYGTEANMEWTVEAGASLKMLATARYGLGYGDKITIYGTLEDALTAREQLTEDDVVFFSHGIVAQESKGWNCDSSMTVKNAYVVIGSNNSFGNKPGNYGGKYTFNFENVVLDGSRITFYEALSTTTFNFKNSDVKVGTFMTNDADSVFTLTNTKFLSTATSNGNDEANRNAGKLILDGSDLTYSVLFTNNGVIELDIDSTITAPAIAGNGKIVVDATGITGDVTVINADLSGFTGTVEVTGADYEITDAGLVIKKGLEGSGTEADPYKIGTAEELFLFAEKVNSGEFKGVYAELVADIDLEQEDWTSIGTSANPFTGTFDGNGYTISNVWCYEQGLFGYTSTGNYVDSGKDGRATIKDLTINGVEIYNQSTSAVGGLVGQAGQNTEISGVTVTGYISIYGYGYVGGLVGQGYVRVDDCHVVGVDNEDGDKSTIDANYWAVGGIVGHAGSEGGSSITNCSVKNVNLRSSYYGAGAIAGVGTNGPIENVSAENVAIEAAYSEDANGMLVGCNYNKITGNSTAKNVVLTVGGNVVAEPQDMVASVNGTYYATLAAAIAAAQAGDTVTLLNDVALTEALMIPADKTITLDLAGKILSYTSDVVGEDMITNYGTLTINDTVGGGKITYCNTDTTGSNVTVSTITNAPGGVLTVNGGTIENTSTDANAWTGKIFPFTIDNVTNATNGAAKTTINGGTIKSNYRSIRLFANSTTDENAVNITGGEMIGQVWLQAPNSKENKVTLTVSGGSFAPAGKDGSSIYVTTANATKPTFQVTGGNFATKIGTDNAALACNDGISGGTFTAAAKENTPAGLIRSGYEFTANDDGTYGVVLRSVSGKISYRGYINDSASREAVQIDLENVYARESLIVKVFDAEGNLLFTTKAKASTIDAAVYTVNAVLWGTPSGSWDTTIAEGVKLTVANAPSKAELWIDGNLLDTFENILGKSTDAAAYQLPAYLALDCVYKEAEINGVYYATLADAIAAAQDGDTITMLSDVELDATIKNTKEITLDLNGKVISGVDNNTSGNYYLINNTGKLTIKDSATGGKITLKAMNDNGYNRSSVTVANNPGGKLVVESGIIEHTGGHTMAYAIDNMTNGKGTYAETVINGGTVESSYVGIRQFLNGVEAQNILTVNGGTVTGANTSIFFQDPSANCNSGKLYVGDAATLGNRIYVSGTAGTDWDVEFAVSAQALGTYGITTVEMPASVVVKEVNGFYILGEIVAYHDDNDNRVLDEGELSFETVAEALAAATSGEIVVLLADTSEATMMVMPGITLDLNGYELTVGYAVTFKTANIVDNTEGDGLLKIGMSNLILQKSNAMIPVYNGEGYVFGTMVSAMSFKKQGDNQALVTMVPAPALAITELFKDGAADNNTKIVIRLTWTAGEGDKATTKSQDIVINEEHVKTVFQSHGGGSVTNFGLQFEITINGIEGIADLQASLVLVSGTGSENYGRTRPLT